jgi:CheY-like chemotaxis protein
MSWSVLSLKSRLVLVGEWAMGKRVLIVDPDKKLVHFLRVSLESLGSAYEVNTFESAEDALRAMTEQPYHLLVTAFPLPGIDGLELVRQARQIDPHMFFMLMVSEESPEVEKAARDLQVYEYLVKPFSVTGLMSKIREALKDKIAALPESSQLRGETTSGETIAKADTFSAFPQESFEAISSVLKEVRSEIGAQCVLLTDILGGVITTAGVTEGLDVTALASLSAGAYAPIFEMSRRLDEEDALDLNFHEGKNYDIYSCNIGDAYLLMIICDRRVCASRVGMVWLCIKRTSRALKSLLVEKGNQADKALGEEFGSSLRSELEKLFDEKEKTEPREEPEEEDPGEILDEEMISLDEAQARGLVVEDDLLLDESPEEEEEDASRRESEGF